MPFIRYNSEPNIQMYKKVASTAFSKNALVAIDANGFITPAVTASVTTDLTGLIQRDVLATDTDYAQNTYCEIDVLVRKVDWVVADIATGSGAQTQVGEAHDITNSLGINVSAAVTPLIRVEKIISTTKAIVSLI